MLFAGDQAGPEVLGWLVCAKADNGSNATIKLSTTVFIFPLFNAIPRATERHSSSSSRHARCLRKYCLLVKLPVRLSDTVLHERAEGIVAALDEMGIQTQKEIKRERARTGVLGFR